MDATLPGGSSVDQTPGQDKTMKTTLMEIGSGLVQSFQPLKQFNLHLCGFAFYSGQPDRQVELHHYCAAINEDVTQCAVFDSPDPNARLIGVEYVISEKLFSSLDHEEQGFWHSHAYDIKSGSFLAPGVPDFADRMLAQTLVKTYGKTFVFWQVDRGDILPLGPPQLMMTANGKDMDWKPELFVARMERRRSGYDPEKILRNRFDVDFDMPHVHLGSDQWRTGEHVVIKTEKVQPKGSGSQVTGDQAA